MRVAIIGTGNLAWHLQDAFDRRVARVVVSRAPDKSWPVPLIGYDGLPAFGPDYVLLAVPDATIGGVAERLAALLSPDTCVVHTSGAGSLDLLPPCFRDRGVLWPIYSFRRGAAAVNWSDIPVVLDASNSGARSRVQRLVERATGVEARFLNAPQRATLHLAATLTNNFGNLLAQLGYELCKQEDIDFDLLLPILRQTANTLQGTPPIDRQTGAAARGDLATMNRHRNLLSDREDVRKLYDLISGMIARRTQ